MFYLKLTLFYTRGLETVDLYVMVPQPYTFSPWFFTKVTQLSNSTVTLIHLCFNRGGYWGDLFEVKVVEETPAGAQTHVLHESGFNGSIFECPPCVCQALQYHHSDFPYSTTWMRGYRLTAHGGFLACTIPCNYLQITRPVRSNVSPPIPMKLYS